MTTLFTTLILIAAALGLLGSLFLYFYWRMVQQPVPKMEGEIDLAILDQPVEVLRDKHGIPHIYAQNRADLFRTQGYVHAQDRLWQMEQNRRTGRGTLAAVFGEVALEADRFSRIIGFRRAAEAELDQIDDETHQILNWYADGVNGYISAHPRKLAAELNLLRIRPEPWTPLDTIIYSKVMAWSLSVNWESELTRLRLLATLGPEKAAELEPNQPDSTPIILEGVGSHALSRLVKDADRLLEQYNKVKAWLGNQGGGQGSNSWVVAPKRSLNNRPLLCNDPHLTHTIPSTWYENGLHCPDYNVSGVSLTGAPGVLIGHNEHIAWGLTNAFPDVQDLYLERAHSENLNRENLSRENLSEENITEDNPRFEYMGEWEEAQVLEERITIRRQVEPHIEQVVITRHGPLISGLLPTNVDEFSELALALQWTGHQPSHNIRAILNLNQASNWQEFDEALADWSTPAQNFTYADSQGNIGYLMAGDIPIRPKDSGLLPAAGWTEAGEWTGMIPHDELPRLYNPDSGFIVTANNRMIADDYPYFMGIEFYPGWRASRIETILQRKGKHTIRDMEEMQLDTGSTFAEALAPWIGLLNSEDPWEKTALNELRQWNYRMDADSAAALVFHYTLIHLLDMTFGDKLEGAELEGAELQSLSEIDEKKQATPLYQSYLGMSISPLFLINGFNMRAELRLLQLISQHEESEWYAEATTGRSRSRDELLQEALTLAVQDIRERMGDSTLRWDWGRSHQVRYVHPMGSLRFLGRFFNKGPFPIGGDGTTPLQTRHALQLPLGVVQVTPSYRQVYEVGAWDRAQTINSSGQSGHPLSNLYDDQIQLWLEGGYHAMPWSREAVEDETVFRTKLGTVDS